MELPDDIKKIYRHWNQHTLKKNPEENGVVKDEKLFEEIKWFVGERISIWKKKEGGNIVPFTEDLVLSKYRFCNIFREFDRQTIEFHTLLNPLRDNFPLWLLNMFYCRLVARPETIKSVGLLSFGNNTEVYKRLSDLESPKYGTPYVFPISTIMRSKTPTRELFLTQYLPEAIPKIARIVSSWNKKSVFDGVNEILPAFGFNLNFLWTEVLIDVAYQFPEYIDLYKQFPIGPGSMPTMKRINPDIDPTMLVTELSRIPVDIGITFEGKLLQLSAENWEGIGCEFRKYSNLMQGKGRKRIYK